MEKHKEKNKNVDFYETKRISSYIIITKRSLKDIIVGGKGNGFHRFLAHLVEHKYFKFKVAGSTPAKT